MTIRTYTLWPDGLCIETSHDTEPTLDWMQNEVGGLIQSVPFFDSYTNKAGETLTGEAYVNEEGTLLQLPFNEPALRLWKGQYRYGYPLFGNLVFVEKGLS